MTKGRAKRGLPGLVIEVGTGRTGATGTTGDVGGISISVKINIQKLVHKEKERELTYWGMHHAQNLHPSWVMLDESHLEHADEQTILPTGFSLAVYSSWHLAAGVGLKWAPSTDCSS